MTDLQAAAKQAVTVPQLAQMQAQGRKIAMLTCYDASFAALLDRAGVDILLIGDSLGNVLQGHRTTLPVTIDQMVYHTACVARSAERALVLADLPFGSYGAPQTAFINAVRLMRAGAQMVKLEGGAWLAETVRALTERGVPVCAHLGLTPQSVHMLGGFRLQGKDKAAAQRLCDDAQTLQVAGAQLLVLEAIPATVARQITAALAIPTIGIGAGPDCSGQVLVLHDMLGISYGRPPRFVRNFLDGQPSIAAAIESYLRAVRQGMFPAPEHCF
jgi:3-methyl-2-oxobutanoate hydroxymethyltransferase